MQQEPDTSEVFPAELLATVGHEFRGPLTTIQGYATTMLRYEQQLTQDERQEFLRAISEASAHLSKLVDRFLELAQLESHVHAFTQEAVNVLALAQESMNAVQPTRTHHLLLTPALTDQHLPGLNGKTEGQDVGKDLVITGDRRLLRTMLDILLENAIVYSAPESLVKISLEVTTPPIALADLRSPTKEGHHQALILPARFREREMLLAVHVQDHGIGISPEHLSLIFHRFYRVDTSLTREANGLGLGLALCKAIVALHGGMLWVSSAVGEGSTFSLVLPREQTHRTKQGDSI